MKFDLQSEVCGHDLLHCSLPWSLLFLKGCIRFHSLLEVSGPSLPTTTDHPGFYVLIFFMTVNVLPMLLMFKSKSVSMFLEATLGLLRLAVGHVVSAMNPLKTDSPSAAG